MIKMKMIAYSVSGGFLRASFNFIEFKEFIIAFETTENGEKLTGPLPNNDRKEK